MPHTEPVPGGLLPPCLLSSALPRASGSHPHTRHTELEAWLPSQSGNWFHFPTRVWLLRRVTPSMWSGFPLLPLLQPVSRLPFNEHLLCAWHFSHLICYYPHDSPVRQGFSPSDSPVRKMKHMCPCHQADKRQNWIYTPKPGFLTMGHAAPHSLHASSVAYPLDSGSRL